MSDILWQALADAYIRGAQGVNDHHAKLIDWKAEAAPIAAEHRNQIIQELIEKAEADGRTFQLSKPISECLDRRQRAQGAADWLKSQIEGE